MLVRPTPKLVARDGDNLYTGEGEVVARSVVVQQAAFVIIICVFSRLNKEPPDNGACKIFYQLHSLGGQPASQPVHGQKGDNAPIYFANAVLTNPLRGNSVTGALRMAFRSF